MFLILEKSITLIFPLNFKFPNNSNLQVFGQGHLLNHIYFFNSHLRFIYCWLNILMVLQDPTIASSMTILDTAFGPPQTTPHQHTSPQPPFERGHYPPFFPPSSSTHHPPVQPTSPPGGRGVFNITTNPPESPFNPRAYQGGSKSSPLHHRSMPGDRRGLQDIQYLL